MEKMLRRPKKVEEKKVYHQGQKLIQVWVTQEEFLKVKLLCSQYGLRSISDLLRLFINSPPGQIYRMEAPEMKMRSKKIEEE
jgi:hypothetical protein